MRGFTLRILGQEVLEFYVGKPTDDGTKAPAEKEHTSVTSVTERPFGFIPAEVEFDKPQPE